MFLSQGSDTLQFPAAHGLVVSAWRWLLLLSRVSRFTVSRVTVTVTVRVTVRIVLYRGRVRPVGLFRVSRVRVRAAGLYRVRVSRVRVRAAGLGLGLLG